MSLALRARAAIDNGDLLTATQAAKALVLERRDAPEGYFLLALAAEQAGQVDNALRLFQAAVERGRDPEHLAQWARLLSLVRRDGDAARAARGQPRVHTSEPPFGAPAHVER